MPHINFLPWVGKNYNLGVGSQNLKFLVLGESHYCYDLGSGKCKNCNLANCLNLGYTKDSFQNQTIEYISDLVYSYTGAEYQQTAICFERAVMGKQLNDSERKEFWNKVIFYNYFQKCLPKVGSERTPVTKNDLIGAEEGLKELLIQYKPDRVVVWGSRLYNLLPNWNGTPSKIILDDNSETDVWTYIIEEKQIPFMKVHHPSTPSGKSWSHWHNFYKLFLD